ncbi:MAG: heparinase II/III family protein [Kiritimatiellae bacterium]|nr:heparinase II/III family protein [Kiritimatiellia bacterium]
MNKTTFVLCTAFVAVAASAKPALGNGMPNVARPEVARLVAAAAARPHPRLFADASGFAAMKARLGKDSLFTSAAEFVRAGADALLDTKPVERIKQGRRLLGVSRTALYRINTLALAYRLYGGKAHLERAVAEMRAACAFSDWNPSHFLDVGEMTLAVATGYDWLYSDMDSATRREIATGLRRCGLDASLANGWWVHAHNNWGQVCHAGILAGALALAEENLAETGLFVQRCVNKLPLSMKALAPNGNYPEGPGYWHYGTEFNVVAMALLEGTLGSDFGLSAMPGFKETGAYPDLVTGPSGETFNYADGGAGRSASCAPWWFAKRFNRPDILAYFELDSFRRTVAQRKINSHRGGNRMLPYALFWLCDVPAGIKPKAPLVWDAKGPVPITIQRSSWDNAKALFVGMKGGSPSGPHGHMDGGSFVLESEGVRWAVDLGAEPYHKIESMGMNLWSAAQNSDRWKLFRLGTWAHNVPMIDGCQQLVKGRAEVLEVKRSGGASEVAFDLSSLYTNATSVVRRGTMAADGRSYTLRDSFAGARPGANIRWAMMTRAAPTVDGDKVTLRQRAKEITLVQCGAQKGEWTIGDGQGPNKWDSPNPGCRQLVFTVPARADGTADVAVKFSF